MKLRAHQRPAVADTVSALTGSARAQLVAACGTGKTVMGATAARRISRGRVLVVVPTLDLLWQTAEAYSSLFAPTTTHVAVCSTEEWGAGSHHGQSTAVTTNPGQLQALTRSEDVVVLSTYASLPVLEEAHRGGMNAWDVALVDEAHRTAGRLGKPWAAIHDDARIPAQRRLYMTATPRVLDEDDTDSDTLASMDNPGIFGDVAHTISFGDAIRAGVLSDYRVVVPVVGQRQLRTALSSQTQTGELNLDAMTATQVALLRSARQYQLQRVVSFHSLLRNARIMAAGLLSTHTAMPAKTSPDTVWSQHIAGSHTTQQRRELLETFADSDHDTAVLSNARVLAEGVDMPTLDGVVFSDPKTSVIDIVQAVGRALRIGDGTGPATVIVPVIHGREDTDDSVLTSSDYLPVWRTLRALRAHDGRLDAQLTNLAEAPSEQELPRALQLDTSLARSRLSATDLALGMAIRTVGHKSLEWRRGYRAARAYYHEHGHLLVSQGYRTEDGTGLGNWINWQRHLRRRDRLATGRVAALDTIGMVWAPTDEKWDQAYAAAQEYCRRHGHLAITRDETVGGVTVGQTIDNYRRRTGQRAEQRQAQLADIDPWWNPPWGVRWQRSYYALRDYVQRFGSTQVPRTWRTDSGMHLGEWLHSQKLRWSELDDAQQQLLSELGANPTQESPRDAAWNSGYAAAAAFRRAYGHLRVPQGYRDEHGYALGTWIARMRRNYHNSKLSPERIAALEGLGMVWDGAQKQWWDRYASAAAHAEQHGTLRVPQSYRTHDGFGLGAWVGLQRRRHANGELPAEQAAALDKLDPDWTCPLHQRTRRQ